ncbi:MAG TPA: sigma-54-dependent Fis family transcriptional regulator, partial [Thermodesulfobacteriota bacterium]|nr:sigma-54-dependent Fis family transcriptional regulator [Thermodesulfobacteriota bacterium]
PAVSFLEALNFFQRKPSGHPNGLEYAAAFCQHLTRSTSADAASIWQVDREDQLRLVYGTDIPQDRVRDIVLRLGEGISGAAALSRQPVWVNNAQNHSLHDSRVDTRFGNRTHAMVSAPILYEDRLFGVVNILNYRSDRIFPAAWKEWLCALAVLYGAALAKAGKLVPYLSSSQKGIKGEDPVVPSLAGKTVIVGISPAVQEVLHLCLKAGETDIPVLIYGETGTGKELAAHRIHEAGPRAKYPFLTVNCAALPETLLESELFGHVKGAFTGATGHRLGKFSAASGGTLFLDEIGEMSPACQAKILRVLEEKKVTPLGSNKPLSSDTRIIAATNKNLSEMMIEKRFREDLFYRLCGIEIRMPSLRERVEDLELLAIHFLKKTNALKGKKPFQNPLYLSPEALDLLKAYPWPGNVRQLEQALSAAAALCEGTTITPANLPAWLYNGDISGPKEQIRYPIASPLSGSNHGPGKSNGFLKEREQSRYLEALQATQYRGTGRWNLSAAARRLGMPRETLAYHLKKLGLF